VRRQENLQMKKTTKKQKGAGRRPHTSAEMEFYRRCGEIVELMDAFCVAHLNNEYQELCRDMMDELCMADFPLDKGGPAGWASGIIHAIGWVNFLHDPQQSPHMTSAQVAEGFGVSQGTMAAKSKIIRDELDVIPMDPDWCTTAMLEDNPLVWMLEVDGFVMDIRHAPREAQEEAYRLGLIPFIPADKQEADLKSGTGTNILKFPSGGNETSCSKSIQQSNDDSYSLFEASEE
jgi:hypothetical protein